MGCHAYIFVSEWQFSIGRCTWYCWGSEKGIGLRVRGVWNYGTGILILIWSSKWDTTHLQWNAAVPLSVFSCIRHSNCLVPKCSHVMNIYFTLLIPFPFKRIFHLKSMNSQPPLFIKILKCFPRFLFVLVSQTYSDNTAPLVSKLISVLVTHVHFIWCDILRFVMCVCCVH